MRSFARRLFNTPDSLLIALIIGIQFEAVTFKSSVFAFASPGAGVGAGFDVLGNCAPGCPLFPVCPVGDEREEPGAVPLGTVCAIIHVALNN